MLRMQDLSLLEMGLIILIFGLYFLPSFISLLRDHKNKLSIFFLNLTVGWTVLGWVISFIWSVMK